MRKALTVGELLITMAIIGVIAMLVLPGFLKDYHNRLYTTRLKKSYEQISDALERASIDSNVSYFAQTKYITNTQEFLQNYFKVSKKLQEQHLLILIEPFQMLKIMMVNQSQVT